MGKSRQPSSKYTLLCGRDQKEPLFPSEISSFLFDFLSGNLFKLPPLILHWTNKNVGLYPSFLTNSCYSHSTKVHALKRPQKFENIVSKNIITEHMIKSNIQLFTNIFVAYLPNVWRLCKLGLGHRGNNSQSFLFAVFIWISTFAFFTSLGTFSDLKLRISFGNCLVIIFLLWFSSLEFFSI